jgi:hypothetical protein
MNLLAARAQDAKAKAAFYAGETDRHPHGASCFITAPEDDRRCTDAASPEHGEWCATAGHDYYTEKWHLWRFKSRRKATK